MSRGFIGLVSRVCALALWAGPVLAQDADDVRIQRVEAAPGVYMLLGRGGNIGVSAGADGIFLIDDQFAPLTAKITAALREIQEGPVRFLLNTHWHGDHTGGNENFGRAGALIVAHHGVRDRMSTTQFQQFFGREVPASPAIALPVVTFNDEVHFHLNGDRIRVLHVPAAHTDGDSIIHFEQSNVLHMGDTYFSGRYPFIDLDSGGSVRGMIAAVERGLELANAETKIIPGHGALSDRAELSGYRDMLVQVQARARAAIDSGQSQDAWIASKPTADIDALWGGGTMAPERFLRIVWSSLAPSAE